MAKGADDLITHCNSARTRVNGSGTLEAVVEDSEGNIQYLAPRTIGTKFVTHLANFKAERVCYEIYLDVEDEWFKVSNQFVYVKLTATSYPQV